MLPMTTQQTPTPAPVAPLSPASLLPTPTDPFAVDRSHTPRGAPRPVHVDILFFGSREQLVEVSYALSLRTRLIAIGRSGREYMPPGIRKCNDLIQQSQVESSRRLELAELKRLGSEWVSHVACRAPTFDGDLCIESVGSPGYGSDGMSTWPGAIPGMPMRLAQDIELIHGFYYGKARSLVDPALAEAMASTCILRYTTGDVSPLVATRVDGASNGHNLSEEYLRDLSGRFPGVVVVGSTIGQTNGPFEEEECGQSLTVMDGRLLAVVEFGDPGVGGGSYGDVDAISRGYSFEKLFDGQDLVNYLYTKECAFDVEADTFVDTMRDPPYRTYLPCNLAHSRFRHAFSCVAILLSHKSRSQSGVEPSGWSESTGLCHADGPGALLAPGVYPGVELARSMSRGFGVLDAALCVGPMQILQTIPPAGFRAEADTEFAPERQAWVHDAIARGDPKVRRGIDAEVTYCTRSRLATSRISPDRLTRTLEICSGVAGNPSGIDDRESVSAFLGIISSPNARLVNGQHVISQLIDHVARLGSSSPLGTDQYDAKGMAAAGHLRSVGLDAVLREILGDEAKLQEFKLNAEENAMAGKARGRTVTQRIREYLFECETPGAGSDNWKLDLAIALCTIPSALAWDLATKLGVDRDFILGCASERPDSVRFFAEVWGRTKSAGSSASAPSPLVHPLAGRLHMPWNLDLPSIALENLFTDETGPDVLRMRQQRSAVNAELERMALREAFGAGVEAGRASAEEARNSAGPRRRTAPSL